MEENKLKDIFASFQPDLTPDDHFMSRMMKNIATIDMVKRHTAAKHRCNRVALAAAAIAGFIMGVILTLLYPALVGWISSFDLALPPVAGFDWQIVGWLIIGAISVICSLNVYELTLARLASSKT